MDYTHIFKLYQNIADSRGHILEMLEDRGYDVEHLKNFTMDEITTMLNDHLNNKFDVASNVGPLDILIEKKDGSNVEKLYVKYRLDVKFKSTASLITQINEIYENILTPKDTLIILNNKRVIMKAGIKDKIDEDFVNKFFITKNYFIQLFGLENFLFNVSRHQFVPKHTILSKQKTQEILTQYNCTNKNIPTIKRDDAQAKYIGLRPRQMCEIEVENVSSGTTEKYRFCVN